MTGDALPGKSASKAGARKSPAAGDRTRNSWRRLGCRGRVSAKHGRGQVLRGRDGALGGGLLLPDAVAGRAAVLGTVLRVDARAGRARPPTLPGREWHGTLGLRRVRL